MLSIHLYYSEICKITTQLYHFYSLSATIRSFNEFGNNLQRDKDLINLVTHLCDISNTVSAHPIIKS